MKELTETARSLLDVWGEFASVILNALSLLSIVIGVAMSFVRTSKYRRGASEYHPLHTHYRMVFGGWLVVALEFQLSADIVETIISPTNGHLIELGAIAAIRTFLNYFLGKELKEQRESLKESVNT
jgi:uncharacterized membrane protein